jgi:hypothetical protein
MMDTVYTSQFHSLAMIKQFSFEMLVHISIDLQINLHHLGVDDFKSPCTKGRGGGWILAEG